MDVAVAEMACAESSRPWSSVCRAGPPPLAAQQRLSFRRGWEVAFGCVAVQAGMRGWVLGGWFRGFGVGPVFRHHSTVTKINAKARRQLGHEFTRPPPHQSRTTNSTKARRPGHRFSPKPMDLCQTSVSKLICPTKAGKICTYRPRSCTMSRDLV